METKNITISVTELERTILRFIYKHDAVTRAELFSAFEEAKDTFTALDGLVDQKLISYTSDGNLKITGWKITRFGVIFAEADIQDDMEKEALLKEKRINRRNYWITTGIAIAALALSATVFIRQLLQ